MKYFYIILFIALPISTYAEKLIDNDYICTVKERYTALFFPTKINKNHGEYAEFQHDSKNEYIENVKIILQGEKALLRVKYKNSPKYSDESIFTKLKGGFGNWKTAYTSERVANKKTEWLLKSPNSNEWRTLGHDMVVNENHENLSVGLMVFDCKY